ncbi:MAG: alanine--tRNA ligase, partial [Bacteroidales bacterium]|nr:alanine--tRNA ligase [Bacteroidales bacterium]
RENGLGTDEAGFVREMQEQRNRSRNAAKLETGDWVELRKIERSEFLGYDKLEAEVQITRYRKVLQKKKIYYQLVFDQTPFYGESGGQAGDSGYISNGDEKIKIFDTRKENNLIVHLSEKLPENPENSFYAVVNGENRTKTANNHTATHLLHAALRKVLGGHVEQKGSLVNAEHLRFDFSHFTKMTDEEIEKVESIVNDKIRENTPLEEKREISMQQAREMDAVMLFGEKYGETVRVIKFGDSVELCGGTHVKATGQIGLFKIISESAIAAGVRRIEAITGRKAENHVNEQIKILKNIRETLKGSKEILESVTELVNKNAELSDKLDAFNRESLKKIRHELKSKMIADNGINIITGIVEVENAAMMKDLAFSLRGEIDSLFLALGAEIGGKPNLTVMISDNLVEEKGLNAAKIVLEAGREIKGGGGGQKFYATAGGKDITGLQAAMKKVLSYLDVNRI